MHKAYLCLLSPHAAGSHHVAQPAAGILLIWDHKLLQIAVMRAAAAVGKTAVSAPRLPSGAGTGCSTGEMAELGRGVDTAVFPTAAAARITAI